MLSTVSAQARRLSTLWMRGYATERVAVTRMREEIQKELSAIRQAGTYKEERVITSKQGSSIKVAGSDRDVMNFCGNNYLGLSSHPDIVQAGIDALNSHAAGMSSTRFICGTNDMHIELEQKISQFHDREATILFPSCFDANTGIFEVLLGPEDEIYTDSLNHASIIDGIRLCKAKKHIFKHRDMKDLESKLSRSGSSTNRKLIVTDGAFSMDGSIAPLRDICDLADKYNALTMIDECHATGFLGKTGRGTEEHCGVTGRVTMMSSTLGKALGGASGGYITGPQELIALLRQRARPYLYSNALPPAVAGCAIKVFDMLLASSDYPMMVHKNTVKFRKAMTQAGFELSGDPDHPICPVMLHDEKLAHQFADEMLERDVYVIGFSYPTVSRGAARIRVQISAAHTTTEIDQCVNAFVEVGKKLGVI